MRYLIQCIVPISAALLVTMTGAQGQTSSDYLRSQIDKLIRYDTDVTIEQVPGFIIGIIDGDSNYVLTYGERSIGSNTPLSAEDVFEIGSLTKVMTAHVIIKLYEKGILEIDHPLNHCLPKEYQNPMVTATIRDVLMHHSGFAKLPETLGKFQTDVDNPYAGFTKENLLEWYRSLPQTSPGAFRYSHAGYALLEVIAEELTGDSFIKLFDRHIAEAFGLQFTHALYRELNCPGYDRARRETTPWTFQSFRASEGGQSCLSDLMTYCKALIQDNASPLLWNTYRETDEKRLQIAFGWYRLLPKKHFPVYVHTGRTSGHSSMMAFTRKTDTAVIILANSSIGTDDLGLLILRMINKQWKRKE